MITRGFLERELGELDPLTFARIERLAPTETDVVEARQWLEGDNDELEATLGHPSNERVQAIIRLVRDVWEEPADGATPSGP